MQFKKSITFTILHAMIDDMFYIRVDRYLSLAERLPARMYERSRVNLFCVPQPHSTNESNANSSYTVTHYSTQKGLTEKYLSQAFRLI